MATKPPSRDLRRHVGLCLHMAAVAVLVQSTTPAMAAEIGCATALTPAALRAEYDDRMVAARGGGYRVSPPKILATLENGRTTAAPVCKGAMIAGPIVAGDAHRVGEFLRENPFVQRLYLNADGANMLEAMEIGRQVRQARVTTVAPLAADGEAKHAVLMRDDLTATQSLCAVGTRCACRGACFYVWAAGIVRDGNVVSAPQDSDTERESSEPARYLAQMGVPPTLATETATTATLSDPLPLEVRYAPALRKAIDARCGKPPTAEGAPPSQQLAPGEASDTFKATLGQRYAGWRACMELVAAQ